MDRGALELLFANYLYYLYLNIIRVALGLFCLEGCFKNEKVYKIYN